MLLLVLHRPAVMRVLIAVLIDGMMFVCSVFMRKRRMFEMNKRSPARPADDKSGREKRNEYRTL